MNVFRILNNLLRNPKSVIEALLRTEFIASKISDVTAIKIFYWLRFSHRINLDSPITYNQKLLWLTLYDRKAIYTKLVDKYDAKEYISNKMKNNAHIIRTYGVYDSISEIDFKDLPDRFVMKTTHDSGGVVLVHDKNKLDWNEVRAKLEPRLVKNYFWFSREWAYKDVKPRIIIEEMIDSAGTAPADYKIYCFHGKAHFVLIVNDRFSDIKEDYMSIDWKRLPFTWGDHATSDSVPEMPTCWNEMIETAELLAKDIPHCRVDFFVDRAQRFFVGELTLTPASGLKKFSPDIWDKKIGSLIDLTSL